MALPDQDLHRSVPDKSELALLLIDVITPLDFPEAGQLLRYWPAMTRKICRLKARAQKTGVPVIYVNDNFGRWRSDFRAQDFCLKEDSRGYEMVRQRRHPAFEQDQIAKRKTAPAKNRTLKCNAQ